MKIGIVCPYNMAQGGGVQEIVLATHAELTKRGHTVRIITPLPRDVDVIDIPDGIFVGASTDFPSLGRTMAQVSATAYTEKIEKMLEDEQFDILHFHEPWIPVLSRQILGRSQSVNIGTFHAKIPETIMSRTVVKVVTPYLKSVLKDLHVLTAVSDSAAEYVGGLTNDPITIIPNGIDLAKYKKADKPSKEKTILFVGRLEPRKGVKYLLRAFSVLSQQDPTTRLIIAGDGKDREKLELLAEDLGLTNVTFLGFVSEELKLQLLADATLYCSPAVYGESFGIVLLEAMASGAVTVAGNNSGYSDVMQDLGAVSVVNPRDTNEFARRLVLLLNNKELRRVWTAWADTYVQQFDWPHVVDQYEEFYHEALKQHGREA